MVELFFWSTVVVLGNWLLEVAWIQVLLGIETFLFNATSRLDPPTMLIYDGPEHILTMHHSLQAKNILCHRVKHTRVLQERASDPVSFVLIGGHGDHAP
jgi:hypothetical protein